MAYFRYTVYPDAHGGYTVEVRSGTSVVEVISGFPNEDRANSWIRERRKQDFAMADRSPRLAPK